MSKYNKLSSDVDVSSSSEGSRVGRILTLKCNGVRSGGLLKDLKSLTLIRGYIQDITVDGDVIKIITK